MRADHATQADARHEAKLDRAAALLAGWSKESLDNQRRGDVKSQ